jgi:type IV pilus assembly protein PilY1
MIGSRLIPTSLLILVALAPLVQGGHLTPSAPLVGLPAVVLAPTESAMASAYTVAPLAGGRSGDVLAWRPVSADSAPLMASLVTSYTLHWSAQQRMQQDELLAGARWSAQRKLFTWDRSARMQVDLRWPLLPAHMQQQLLNSSPQGALLGGEALVNYVRGDRSNEGAGGLLPQREWLLGDTRTSQPVYLADGSRTQAARLVVGTTRGVLHVLDAATGQERWAYLPSALVCAEQLATAAACSRQPAQMMPASGRVELQGRAREVLVAGLGGAAAGWFALDVTSSSPLADVSQGQHKQRVLWELGAQDDEGVGHFYGKPAIARLKDGHSYVIAGNGYNSRRGEAALYLIRIADGQVIRLGTGSGNPMSPNGLSAPALVDSDFDDVADRVYAGDVAGQLWKFDLSSSRTADWGVAAGAKPLFSAGPAHPMLLAPEVAQHAAGFLVYVATGHAGIVSAEDAGAVQLIIAVSDGVAPAAYAPELILSQPLTQRFAGIERQVRRVKRVVGSTGVTAAAWQLRLPSGLSPMAPPRLRGGRLWVNLHDSALLSNTQLALDYLHGGAPAGASFDLNNDGRVDAADNETASVGLELGTGLWSSPTVQSVAVGQDRHYSQYWSINALTRGEEALVIESAPVVSVAAGPNFRPGRRSWIDITSD